MGLRDRIKRERKAREAQRQEKAKQNLENIESALVKMRFLAEVVKESIRLTGDREIGLEWLKTLVPADMPTTPTESDRMLRRFTRYATAEAANRVSLAITDMYQGEVR